MDAALTPAAAGLTARAAERVQVDRRTQILEAARAVLGRQGYAETSTKDIAREAGVAPGLLHYYFESKEEILIEVVEGLIREIVASHRDAVQGFDDPLEAVSHAMDLAAERCSGPGFCRLLLDSYSLALSNPSVRERLRPMLDEMIASTQRTAEEIKAGLAVPDIGISMGDLATAIVGAMDGVAMLSTIREQDPGGAYRALKILLMAFVVLGYVAKGEEPPLTRLLDLAFR